MTESECAQICYVRIYVNVVSIPVTVSVQNLSYLGDVPLLKDICHERALQFTGFNCFQWSRNALSPALMGFSFFNGDENRSVYNGIGKSNSRTTRGNLFDGRVWTNILLATNVL